LGWCARQIATSRALTANTIKNRAAARFFSARNLSRKSAQIHVSGQPNVLCYTHWDLITAGNKSNTNNEEHAMGITDRPYSEKRDFIRMKIGAPLSAKLAAPAAEIEGLCLDLSGGGLQVETKQSLAVGTETEVEVSSDHGHSPTLKARTKVVRVTANETGNYVLGLEILHILPS
jgi:hypothetical protein